MQSQPKFEDVLEAQARIKAYVHNTPVLSSTSLNQQIGAEVYLKCENFQKCGAFKARGATNSIFKLDNEAAKRGVVAHSAGNHAGGVAYAAKARGIPATIIVPKDAPEVKKCAVREYGAKLIESEPSFEARAELANQVLIESGGTLIPSFNYPDTIAGQGTAALELLEEVKELDYLLTPLGGGGLLSGTALSVSGVSLRTKVIGVEPEEADDGFRSFKAGTIQSLETTNTIADGLRAPIGEIPFAIIKDLVDDITTVSEEEIISAMRYIWERMKIVIEPSSAVPIAALLAKRIEVSGKVGVIISGGNVDLDNFFKSIN